MLLNLNFIRLTHIIDHSERVYMFCDCQRLWFWVLRAHSAKGPGSWKERRQSWLVQTRRRQKRGLGGTKRNGRRTREVRRRRAKILESKEGWKRGRRARGETEPVASHRKCVCGLNASRSLFSLFVCESVAVHRAAWPTGEQIFLFFICMYAG